MQIIGIDDGELSRSEHFPDVSHVGECGIFRAQENRNRIQRRHRLLPRDEQRDGARSDAECEEWKLFNQQAKSPVFRKAP